MRDSAQVPIPASFQPLLFPSPEGNMTKIRLPLLHESSEQSCKSAPFKKQSCKSAEGSMPVETIFRSFRRGWREGLSCKSACGTGVLTKKNCTATLTHIVSKLPCSYVRARLNYNSDTKCVKGLCLHDSRDIINSDHHTHKCHFQ